MSIATTALTIVQTAGILNELVRQYQTGQISQKQLVSRWAVMQDNIKTINDTWDALEAKERDQ